MVTHYKIKGCAHEQPLPARGFGVGFGWCDRPWKVRPNFCGLHSAFRRDFDSHRKFGGASLRFLRLPDRGLFYAAGISELLLRTEDLDGFFDEFTDHAS